MKLFNQHKKDILSSLLCIGKNCAQSPHANLGSSACSIWPITLFVNREGFGPTLRILQNCRICRGGLLSPILFSITRTVLILCKDSLPYFRGGGVLVTIGGVDPELNRHLRAAKCDFTGLKRVWNQSYLIKQGGESCHVQHVHVRTLVLPPHWVAQQSWSTEERPSKTRISVSEVLKCTNSHLFCGSKGVAQESCEFSFWIIV